MSESKHTPGPWEVDGPPRNQIVWSDAENRVCFLAHSSGRNDERDLANGRLIAAAPDLLEAAKAVAQWVNQRPDTHPYEAWVKLEAAIAKAEGRS